MKKIEIFGKKVPLFAILIVIMVIGTASAAVFLNYATLSGTVDVSNGISVTDSDGETFEANGEGALNFDSPATFTINNEGETPTIVDLNTIILLNNDLVTDEVVTDFAGLTVGNSVIEGTDVENGPVLVPPGGLTVDVYFVAAENAMPGDYTILVEVNVNLTSYDEFDGDNAMETVSLSNKDPAFDWASYGNTASVNYASMGDEFYYELSATGLDDVEHCLIYYADKEEPRNVNWGGDNPGAIIAVTIPSGGVIDINGIKVLDMNLPHADDWNSFFYDYSGEPDYYDNAHGAKLWLVPSDQVDQNYVPYQTQLLIDWGPDMILFEEELIHYIDTDL